MDFNALKKVIKFFLKNKFTKNLKCIIFILLLIKCDYANDVVNVTFDYTLYGHSFLCIIDLNCVSNF